MLDEGDRLLDEGFERQLSQIIEASSRIRQTLCFSATMPADLKRMLDSGAVRRSTSVGHATGAAGSVDQTASRVDLRRVALPKGADALGALANVLKKHREGRAGSKVVVFLADDGRGRVGVGLPREPRAQQRCFAQPQVARTTGRARRTNSATPTSRGSTLF